MIKINNLTKIYPRSVVANDHIDLGIQRGELFCLLGSNGAGKSTLIKQIAVESKPTKGSIHVLGIDVVRNPLAVKKNMGIMPQECGMFEHLTVRQHIQIFSHLKGLNMKDSFRCVNDVLHNLGLEDRQNVKIGELSLGLKRKVLLSIALLGNPPILILDEPTTGLDPESRMNVWQLLLKKKQEGITVLLTTHLLEEAEHLSDRFGVISKGRIIYSGTIGSLFSHSGHRYELKYQNGLCSNVSDVKYFDDLFSAFSFIKGIKPKRFSLSTISLERIYFELVQHSR